MKWDLMAANNPKKFLFEKKSQRKQFLHRVRALELQVACLQARPGALAACNPQQLQELHSQLSSACAAVSTPTLECPSSLCDPVENTHPGVAPAPDFCLPSKVYAACRAVGIPTLEGEPCKAPASFAGSVVHFSLSMLCFDRHRESLAP